MDDYTNNLEFNFPAQEDQNSTFNFYIDEFCRGNFPEDNVYKDYTPKPDNVLKTEKPKKLFDCKECTKTYRSKENLIFHIKNFHLKQKPYKCNYCSSLFSHRNGKSYHERKFHTLYMPHKCEDCPCCFANKSALRYHTKSKHKMIK